MNIKLENISKEHAALPYMDDKPLKRQPSAISHKRAHEMATIFLTLKYEG